MMNIPQNLQRQIRPVALLVVIVFTPAVMALGLLVAVNQATGIKVSVFTRDPIQVLDGQAYVGVYSNVGILIWAAAAVSCFFAAAVLHRCGGERSWRKFLTASGIVTSILLIDDLFLMHELVLPEHVGIPEALIVPAYGLMLLAYLWTFRRNILATDFLILVLALGLFGFSAGIDVVALATDEFHGVHLLEDGFKFLGIVAWTTYLVNTSLNLATEVRTANAVPLLGTPTEAHDASAPAH